MKKAMILAAGYGTRLKPYTLLRPKPLFPVLGKPLLLHTIDKLRQSGFGPIIVNCHYLKGQIVDLLHKEQDVILQEEDIELGTGGGLRMALEQFDDQPILVTNGDIFHSIDYKKVYLSHVKSGATVSLVMHDFPRFNKVQVDGNHQIISFDSESPQDILRKHLGNIYAFTGIHIINPHVLSRIPFGTFYNIIDLYRKLINSQDCIAAIIEKNHYWHDIGTPVDYLDLHAFLLQSIDPKSRQFTPVNDQGFYLEHGALMTTDVKFVDWGFVCKGATVGKNVRLERVVVWENVNIADGSDLRDCIVTS